ncbi:MAG TPA: GNAT family N-acetyltransferase [Dongiaceae bacterium]|jgi:ribosomal protein S18 acetylase RimI-like enzyme
MTDAIAIRAASAAEAECVLAIMRRAFGAYRGRLVPESSVFTETVPAIAEKLAGGGGLLADQGSKAVGCVIAEDLGDRAYLGRLSVDPGMRGLGLGRRLALRAEDFARSRGRALIELNVRIALPGNIAFFESLGYRETERRAHPGYPEPTYLVMEKSLE